MVAVRGWLRRSAVIVPVSCVLVAGVCSGARASTQVGGPFLGSAGFYDYSDSGIGDTAAGTETHWWCGDTASHQTDTILREQYRLSDWSVVSPEQQVLAEGAPGAWDSAYTCNPSVVQGQFVNPLGDGVTYGYAMYYVGTTSGSDNSIGAAFSQDGVTWRKYPSPVLTFTDTGHGYYGYGQPNASIVGARVQLLFEDWDAGQWGTHWSATAAPDGVSFAPASPVTSAGLPSSVTGWGGAAFDPVDGRWYAVFNDAFRSSGTTGGVGERGQLGVTLYATGDLAAGAWSELDTIDTVVTGSESNFIAGLLRDPDGDLSSAFLPGVRVDVSQSWPRPVYSAYGAQLGDSGAFNQWQIAWHQWSPGNPWRTLQRVDYAGGHHEVTTGWWDSSVYHLEAIALGKLAEAPTGAASVPVFLCKAAATDYVDTLRPDCNGWYQAGLLGYISPSPGAGLVPIYSCVSGVGHFVSPQSSCEGQGVDTLESGGLLGYAQS